MDFTKQITVSKFSKGLNIGSAFNKLLSEIEGILELKSFPDCIGPAWKESIALEVRSLTKILKI